MYYPHITRPRLCRAARRDLRGSRPSSALITISASTDEMATGRDPGPLGVRVTDPPPPLCALLDGSHHRRSSNP